MYMDAVTKEIPDAGGVLSITSRYDDQRFESQQMKSHQAHLGFGAGAGTGAGSGVGSGAGAGFGSSGAGVGVDGAASPSKVTPTKPEHRASAKLVL